MSKPSNKRRGALEVRVHGPGVQTGRFLLVDLALLGRQLQSALDRVTYVLSGEATSIKRGRAPKPVRQACALEVVADAAGSYVLGLDLRREQYEVPGTDSGEAALECLVEGLDGLDTAADTLPRGYDAGVLLAWRELGTLLGRGIEGIDLDLQTRTRRARVTFNAGTYARITERLRQPLPDRIDIEGRLLMADFKELGTRCRIHPPSEPPVVCTFDEALAPAVLDNIRRLVRVSGQAERDATGKIKVLRIDDLQPLAADAEVMPAPDEFWCEQSLEELAAVQGVVPPAALDEVVGRAADLWDDDDAFDAFVKGIYDRRREGREAEETHP